MTTPTYPDGAACCAVCRADVVYRDWDQYGDLFERRGGSHDEHHERACELTVEVRRLRAAVEEAHAALQEAEEIAAIAVRRVLQQRDADIDRLKRQLFAEQQRAAQATRSNR